LVRKRAQKFKDYEQSLEDAPQEQVDAHGIASLPDSGGKFERMLDLLRIMMGMVKKGEYRDAESILGMVYGKKDESFFAASQRSRLQDLAEGMAGQTAKDEKQWLLEDLEKERAKWHQAWKDHLETMRAPSVAELNACFVPKGKAWAAATRQAAQLDQRIDKKMRLYWETQKQDRERMVRQYEEAKLEATPEEQAAEQDAKEFIGKFAALIHEMDAKLKAVEEGQGAAKAAEATEVAKELSHSTDNCDTTASTNSQKPDGSAAVPTGEGSEAPSEAGPAASAGEKELAAAEKPSCSNDNDNLITGTECQKPSGEGSEAASGSSAGTPAEVSEQSGALVENKGSESENKPETEPGPIE